MPPQQRADVEAGQCLGLEDWIPGDVRTFRVPRHRSPGNGFMSPLAAAHGDSMYSSGTVLCDDDSMVACCVQDGAHRQEETLFLMPRAGPRRRLHWNPELARAVIVNCGGLCPGLNAVIRELVITLHSYGVHDVRGVRGGYQGVVDPGSWMDLTVDVVDKIHRKEGTILQSDRGNPPHAEMVETLRGEGVTHVFVIGGDGSQKGAMQLHDAAVNIGYEVSICGIPKTIDNDLPLLDFTFGYHTAVSKAADKIDVAYTEACGNANCISIVELMGRHSGFIAREATIAARNVDLCLLPEMNVDMDRCLDYIVRAYKQKQDQDQGGLVIVVAEGLGDQDLLGADSVDTANGSSIDKGGNRVLADIGPWFKKRIEDHVRELDLELSVKLIPRCYSVRATSPDTFDSVYCGALAHNAVHGAMAGYTGFCVGRVKGEFVMLPIPSLVGRPIRRVDVHGEGFARMVFTTKQPPMSLERIGTRQPPMSEVAQGFAKRKGDFEEVCASLLSQDVRFRRCEVDHLAGSASCASIETPLEDPWWPGCHLEQAEVSHELDIYPDGNSYCTPTFTVQQGADTAEVMQFLRAGPRRNLHREPGDVKALIVNRDNLCPGVNSVIREIVTMLHLYGVRDVYGVQDGFKGMADNGTWEALTPETVQNIHLDPACILRAGMGVKLDDEEVVASACKKFGVTHVYIIGGYTAHRQALQAYEVTKRAGLDVSICAIPKTIDNDLAVLDVTFGHSTVVSKAKEVIECAQVEASSSADDCVTVVKLMGKRAGHIALQATLAARGVDLCLIPEMHIDWERCFDYLLAVLNKKGRGAVVVLAGGLKYSESVSEASGGQDILPWFEERLKDHARGHGKVLKVKPMDPRYMLRAADREEAIDSRWSAAIAQNAVHGAMAGYSGFTTGQVSNQHVMLPIEEVVKRGRSKVNIHGSLVSQLLCVTGQPPEAAGPPMVESATAAGETDSEPAVAPNASMCVEAAVPAREVTLAAMRKSTQHRKPRRTRWGTSCSAISGCAPKQETLRGSASLFAIRQAALVFAAGVTMVGTSTLVRKPLTPVSAGSRSLGKVVRRIAKPALSGAVSRRMAMTAGPHGRRLG